MQPIACQDILTALAFLKARHAPRPELIGLGDAGILRLFAAAVAPIAIDVIADLNGFGGSDEDFRERFFVPGIQRAGGLSAALKLVNRTCGDYSSSLHPPNTNRLAGHRELDLKANEN